MTDEQIKAIRDRIQVDPIAATLIRRLSIRTTMPTSTKERDIGCYAVASGVPTSRKAVRSVVLFMSEIDVGEFFQDPERRCSKIIWKVDARVLARVVLGLGWSPSDAEIDAFMGSL
jgi:hypothetical protein